jgi:transcriptional regulator with XRE-family HTH domain
MGAQHHTARSLHRITGIPRSRLNDAVSGRKPFKMDDLIAVAQVLGVTASTLIERAETRAAA